jgi:hypothetical protein
MGGRHEAEKAAALRRFIPKGIQQILQRLRSSGNPAPGRFRSSTGRSLSNWAVGTDPGDPIEKIRELLNSGITIVNFHSVEQPCARGSIFTARKSTARRARRNAVSPILKAAWLAWSPARLTRALK